MNNDTALKILLNSLELGIVLTGPQNKVIFINEYLKKYLDIYSYENIDLNKLFEVFYEDKILETDQICGYSDAQTTGVIFEKEPLILSTNSNQTKIVNIKTIKNKRLHESNITSLIIIKDIEEKAELEKMKVDFSSQTVHILRTPLSIIRNNLDSFKKSDGYKNLNDREKKNIEEVVYGSNELLSLLQNLITVNEIENERIDLQFSVSNISKIIEQAVKELEEVKIKTGNEILIINPIYEIPEIKADVLKLVSVFKGIIMNSLKHSSNSEIQINISKDISNLIINIKDKGEGISETGLRFIFNKFYHSKKNPLVMEQGLGIGLYYCKKVIESHMGSIEISSQKGIGTEVVVKLPL
jgi:signal transduction histidine kinase